MIRSLAGIVAALALAIVPGALGRPAAMPGVTPDTILIGGTVPLSGPASLYAPAAAGAAAYFDYVNATGGVFGRTIEYRVVDDAYNPAQTVAQTRRLVQEDGVFAIFNSVGTEQSLAARPLLNQMRVPQLFVGTGVSTLARESRRYPWTLGFWPSFRAEGKLYGRYIARNRPRGRIAVIYEGSEYGEDTLAGLRAGLRGSRARIVRAESVDPTTVLVASHIARLRATRADTLVIVVAPTQTIQSFMNVDRLSWRPQIFVTSPSVDPAVMELARFNTNGRATEGAITMVFLKDPTNPRWAKDPGVRLYHRIMRTHLPNENAKAVAHFYGMATAYSMVDALRKAGRNPTRDSLLRAATSLNERNHPFLIPGIALRTSQTDYRPIEKAQLYRFRGRAWRPLGDVVLVRD